MSELKNKEAVAELLLKMADDALVLGHRNSEWIGIGPAIEEDIAFGSLAQDKVGHAYNLYQLLHTEFGKPEPDLLAFSRNEKDMKCCHLVELPSSDYAFSLVRHFLFDHAELLRYELLSESSYGPLANLAKKYKAEIKYHVFHANTWVKNLAKGTEESKARIQSALNEAYPLAMGIFEPGAAEADQQAEGVFAGEASLQAKWEEVIQANLSAFGLTLPATDGKTGMGGRNGYHTEHLQPLLTEMTEVIHTEAEGTEW